MSIRKGIKKLTTITILCIMVLAGCNADNKSNVTGKNLDKSVSPEAIAGSLLGKTADSVTQLSKELGVVPKEDMFEDKKAPVEVELYGIHLDAGAKEGAVIEISTHPGADWRYLIFEKNGDKWRFKGNIDLPGQRSNFPQIRIVNSNISECKKTWLIINVLTGYGTGIYSVNEVWYSIEGLSINEELSYLVKGHEWMSSLQAAFTNVTGHMLPLRIVPKNEKDSKFYTDILYHIRFTDSKAMDAENEEDAYLFSAERRIRYLWDPIQNKFQLDGENSNGDETFLNFDASSIVKNYADELARLAKSRIPHKKEWLNLLYGSLKEISLEDQKQVEKLIKEYFNALEKKDFAAAYELQSSGQKQQCAFEDFQKSWEKTFDAIKLLSIRGYLPPDAEKQLSMREVLQGMPTVYFEAEFKMELKPGVQTWNNGVNMRFVNVKKESDGNWYIDGLATGP